MQRAQESNESLASRGDYGGRAGGNADAAHAGVEGGDGADQNPRHPDQPRHGNEQRGQTTPRADLTPPPDAKEYVFGYSAAGEIIEVRGNFPRLRPVCAWPPWAGMRNMPITVACRSTCCARSPAICLTNRRASPAWSATTRGPSAAHGRNWGEFGAVLGLGIVGNLAAQLAQLSGARVMAWEGLDFRIDTARRCGIRQCVGFTRADAKTDGGICRALWPGFRRHGVRRRCRQKRSSRFTNAWAFR